MCGIAGIVGDFDSAQGVRLAERMNQAIVHRGPDDGGSWGRDGFAFAMRRLSIIDLEGGHQPMWATHSEGNGVGIVFNGEIYNYRVLRQELQAKGERFQTQSDTETILRLYARDGIDGLNRLEGMYAICLYDPASRCIHLVRDRMGIKPLYYAEVAGQFLFASEIKAILAALDKPPAIDSSSLSHYLTLRYVPSPSTIWQNIKKLEPGCRLTLDLETKRHKIERYWTYDINARPLEPERDYVGEFEALFLGAVEKRLVAADVPVGVMLSGGLDSSAVCAAAVELGHKAFNTFSVGFEDGGEYSEASYAREMAEHVGATHHELVIGKKDFLDFLPDLVRHTDEPLADLASVPLFFVSRLARDSVKVVLSGEGSDEVLAGYDMEVLASRLARLRKIAAWVPPPALRLIAAAMGQSRGAAINALADTGWTDYLKGRTTHMTHVWEGAEKQALLRSAGDSSDTTGLIRSWHDLSTSTHPLDRLQQAYCHSWLVEDLLMKADKMSMANSLELRVPFLDHKLIEWAAKLPMEWKVGGAAVGWSSKRILREFASTRLPQRIISRPKQGFPVPAYDWLANGLSSWAEDRIFAGGRLAGLLDLAPARQALSNASHGDRSAAHKVWTLLILDHWLEAWT